MSTSTEGRTTDAGRARVRTVRLGPDLVVGGARVPVIAAPRRGADAVHVSLRTRRGGDAPAELTRLRRDVAAPLLVEPSCVDDLPAIGALADAVVIGAESAGDAPLATAVGRLGLPVVVYRAPEATVDDWLACAERVRAEADHAEAGRAGGVGSIVLADGGVIRGGDGRVDLDLATLAEARRRSGLPVVADVGTSPELAAAAVAAGADAVWLAESARPAAVDRAVEVVALVTPLVREAQRATLAQCREAIDAVDATLAALLERRAALAGQVQRLKPVGGHAGRDAQREADIVRAMAVRAPSLGHESLARIMEAVISAGLDLAEREHPTDPPVWRL